MPAVFGLDVSGSVSPILRHMAATRPQMAAAEASAATGAARWVRRNAAADLVKELDLPPRVVNSRLLVFRARRPSEGRPAIARVRAHLRPINPGGLNTTLTRSGRTVKGKVGTAIRAANRIYERAWLARTKYMSAKSNSLLLQREYGAARYPIDAPKIAFDHAKSVTRKWLSRAEPEFRRLFQQSLARSLRRRGLTTEGTGL